MFKDKKSSVPSSDDEFERFINEIYSHHDDSTYQMMELDMSDIDKLTVDKDLFKKGIDSVSEICGAICALTNVGVSPESAMAYISSKYEADMTYKTQVDLSEDINKTNIKVAELSGEAQMKSQI